VPPNGFWVIFGVGPKIFGGKVHPSSELRVFRHLWSRSDEAKIWASSGVPSSPTRSRRKTSRPEGTPLDLRLPHREIGIILRCNPWAAGWSPEGTFRGFVWGKYAKIRKLGNFDARSSATIRRTEKLVTSRKLPGPWTTTRSKQYLSVVHPVTCSLLWVRCLCDLIYISDFGKNDP